MTSEPVTNDVVRTPGEIRPGGTLSWRGHEDGSADRSLPERFESMVEAHPDNVAVDDRAHSGRQMTYRELDRAANRVANALVDRLGDQHANVAVLCDDDLSSLPAILGTLKANKAYVPLESGGPPVRLRGVMEHSDVELVLSGGSVSWETGAPVLDIAQTPDHDSAANITVETDRHARIMYTSGSTGTPKGVVQSHGYVLHKVHVDTEYFGHTASDRLTQLLSITFGMSTTHVFGALLNGATLCPYDPTKAGFERLGTWLDDVGITCFQVSPSLFRRFLERMPADTTYPNMRYVALGGERLNRRDLELFQRHFVAPAVLLNQLAATEIGPISRNLMDMNTVLDGPIVPAGFPAPYKRLEIIDDHGNAKKAGQPGEIVVHTSLSSDGYWAQPELTAQIFRRTDEGVAYRTGDLGLLNEDGSLDHLGRKDARVKVRGYGVDLVEVERALLTVDGVDEAVASVHEPDDGLAYVVAHVVATESMTAETIRTALAPMLPGYAIPTAVAILAEMPLTSRGKIDRKALLLPDSSASDTAYAPPTDELETNLVEIWQDVLKVTDVGIDHDFADLGGTSIQALEAFAELDRRHGVNVPPTTLMRASNIRALAAEIRAGVDTDVERNIIAISAEGSGTPLFCVHGGGGGVFFMGDIDNNLSGNRPVFAIQATGFEGTPPPYRTAETMASDYIAEIRTFQETGPYFIAGLSFGGIVATEIAHQLLAAGDGVGLLAILDTRFPGREVPRSKVERVRQRTSGMSLGRLLKYLRHKLTDSLRRRSRARALQKKLAEGGPLPLDGKMRENYFWALHQRASREYQMRAIDVSVLVIAAEGLVDQQQGDWSTIADRLQVVEVHADHFDMVREPAVATTARHLQEAMDAVDTRI